MKIIFNGNETDTYAKNIMEFLDERDIDSRTVATALDGQFIPRAQHASQRLSEGMRLEVLAPMQGG